MQQGTNEATGQLKTARKHDWLPISGGVPSASINAEADAKDLLEAASCYVDSVQRALSQLACSDIYFDRDAPLWALSYTAEQAKAMIDAVVNAMLQQRKQSIPSATLQS